jgi:ABC-type branched-subunit amino acid transport system substrate-binding protein
MLRGPTARSATRHRAAVSLSVAALTALGLGACGRSSGGGGGNGGNSAAPSSAAATSSSAANPGPGDFGTLKKICGPGNATAATERGVTATTIRIGVTADPGSTAAPGLEQEFFDTADGFAKWCNAAGGINGRKLVIDKWDAKLFNVGQVMTSACLKDFMLVGNGNAFDSGGVKIRVGCKLAQIPSYVVSPEAVTAPYQVQATPVPPTQINDGGIRLLAQTYPDTKAGGVGIGSSTLASIAPVGLRTAEYLRDLGIKVAVIQDQPPLVTNYRPYMEQLKSSGAVGYYGISAQDATPIVQAMKNIGYNPSWILYSPQFYGPQAAQAAKALGTFPPSYVQFGALPFDLVSDFPVLQQTESIVKAAVTNPKLTAFTDSAFSAWTLWAESATECGSTLTSACVLQHAQQHTDWTAGGLYPPHSTALDAKASPCIAIVKLSTTGFSYDKSVTRPTDGVFNCDPENVKTVKTYQTTS